MIPIRDGLAPGRPGRPPSHVLIHIVITPSLYFGQAAFLRTHEHSSSHTLGVKSHIIAHVRHGCCYSLTYAAGLPRHSIDKFPVLFSTHTTDQTPLAVAVSISLRTNTTAGSLVIIIKRTEVEQTLYSERCVEEKWSEILKAGWTVFNESAVKLWQSIVFQLI